MTRATLYRPVDAEDSRFTCGPQAFSEDDFSMRFRRWIFAGEAKVAAETFGRGSVTWFPGAWE